MTREYMLFGCLFSMKRNAGDGEGQGGPPNTTVDTKQTGDVHWIKSARKDLLHSHR